MTMPHPGKLDDELGVLISLVISLGMIVLAVAGWWLLNIFPNLVGMVMSASSVEIP